MNFTAIKKISIPTKQEALYFDQILLKKIEDSQEDDLKKSQIESVLGNPTFKYLSDNRIVAIAGYSDYLDKNQLNYWFNRNKLEGREEEKSEKDVKRVLKAMSQIKNEESYTRIYNYIKFLIEQNEIRDFSLFLREQRGLDAVPLLDNDPLTLDTNIQNIKLGAVRVILNSIPVPIENEVPWEQIIDFRNDEDARHKLIALRMWMRNVVTRASTVTEIKEELDYLLYEYEKRMKIHKIRYTKGFVQALLSAPIGFVINLVKGDVNKSVDSIFSIAQAKINLLEKELDTPGREVAYIRYIAEKLG